MRLPLETDPAVQADQTAAAAASALASRASALAPPPALLDGWSSLCAAEYARAVIGLRVLLGQLVDVLQLAGRPS